MPTQLENFTEFCKTANTEAQVEFLAAHAPRQLHEELVAKYGNNISRIANIIYCISR